MEQTKGLFIAAVRQEETKTRAKTEIFQIFSLSKIWDIKKNWFTLLLYAIKEVLSYFHTFKIPDFQLLKHLKPHVTHCSSNNNCSFLGILHLSEIKIHYH